MTIIVITAISLGGLAFLAGAILYIASVRFAVEEDPMVGVITDVLPGANCGACGVPGCAQFAEKLVLTKDMSLYCPVGGADVAHEIAELMGLEAQVKEKMVARVMCQGGDNATRTGEYKGIKSCRAVVNIGQSDLTCPYGCLGYGDCVESCEFDAIHIINGVAVVDEEKCTSCEACVLECPVNIIEMQPYNKAVFVACKSLDPGGAVRKYCTVGCTGCKKCVKACGDREAIFFDNNLAAIIVDKCKNCPDCVPECATNTIVISKNGLARIAAIEEEPVHAA
jgi:electron transport complex protein RnfB